MVSAIEVFHCSPLDSALDQPFLLHVSCDRSWMQSPSLIHILCVSFLELLESGSGTADEHGCADVLKEQDAGFQWTGMLTSFCMKRNKQLWVYSNLSKQLWLCQPDWLLCSDCTASVYLAGTEAHLSSYLQIICSRVDNYWSETVLGSLYKVINIWSVQFRAGSNGMAGCNLWPILGNLQDEKHFLYFNHKYTIK